MGKIIFSNVHPELLKKIKNFCSEKGLPAATFEDLSAGMNHAEIGALMAEKWNFPPGLINSIRYHHDPNSAPKEYRDLVSTVYMANMFCELENHSITFDQLEPGVLKKFNIASKEQIDILIEKFNDGFEKESIQSRR
jgi:HD-like signal output (HDOD) protein